MTKSKIVRQTATALRRASEGAGERTLKVDARQSGDPVLHVTTIRLDGLGGRGEPLLPVRTELEPTRPAAVLLFARTRTGGVPLRVCPEDRLVEIHEHFVHLSLANDFSSSGCKMTACATDLGRKRPRILPLSSPEES